MTLPLAVTVTSNQPSRYLDEAKAKAAEWGLPFVERYRRLPDGHVYFVLGHDGWELRDGPHALGFTPGLAVVRIKRLGTPFQEDDVLVRLCELKAGDSLFDGTFGLGADSLVCARVVGPTGRVIATEASKVLFLLAREGLAHPKWREWCEGSARIELHHATAVDQLRSMADGSVDCVILDPMFEVPKAANPTFEFMRRFAVHEPLGLDTIDEARRVARRWVVVKGGRFGKELKRLGLEEIRLTRTSPTIWGRVGPA